MTTRTLRSGVLGLFVLAGVVATAEVAAGQTVAVWLTSNDQTKKMKAQRAVRFAPGPAGSNVVFVDETQVHQEIEGFGASFTDSAAYLLNQVATPAARNSAMKSLFTRAGTGIGVSFVRNPMGGSDLARFHYSYDDLPPGQTDPDLTQFSIAHDQADIIPLVQQARRLNPQLKIMASPWSPPGWMKSSGSMIGGSLLPSMYGPFANYFVKYVQAYAAAGIRVDYVSLQNEPLFVPSDYPGMLMDAATQTIVLRDFVLPAFAANNISTRLQVYDHNWDRRDYPDTVLADSTISSSPRVAGTAWHWYGGTPGAMTTVADNHPGKGNWVTEASGGTWISDQVRADFTGITHAMRSDAKSFVKWSLALDQNRGPHAGGCGVCTPLVTVNTATRKVSYPIDFYTLGHFSKFVLPGARRIWSSNGAGIVSAAFSNPGGSRVLVAFNDTPANNTFQVRWGTRSFNYTLPGLSGATFRWSGRQAGRYVMSAKSQIQASSFNGTSGLQTESTTDTQGGYNLGYAEGGDWAVYRDVDFGSGVAGVDVRVASGGTGGTLELRVDAVDGPLLGEVPIPTTGGWQSWETVSAVASGATGVRDLFLVFRGTTEIGNVNWVRFR
jgi:glucosylceramidase